MTQPIHLGHEPDQGEQKENGQIESEPKGNNQTLYKTNYMMTAAALGVVAVPAVVVGPAIALTGLVGFTGQGIAAGSLAAGIQTGIGAAVGAGSAFATLQSAAMGGYGVATLATGVQATAGAVGAIAGTKEIWNWLNGTGNKETQGEETNDGNGDKHECVDEGDGDSGTGLDNQCKL